MKDWRGPESAASWPAAYTRSDVQGRGADPSNWFCFKQLRHPTGFVVFWPDVTHRIKEIDDLCKAGLKHL
jgi:hypothetical protein